MKSPLILVTMILVLVSACSRTTSDGMVQLQIADWRDRQPVSLLERGQQVAGLAPLSADSKTKIDGEEKNSEKNHPAAIYLDDAERSLKDIVSGQPEGDRENSDEDGHSEFRRVEGKKTAVIDINGDDVVDGIVENLEPGDAEEATITRINTRKDGAFIWTENNKVRYRSGDVIQVHVRGYLPGKEKVTVQIWNAWNGGFLYWESEPRELEGEFDYTVHKEIPIDWPATNDPDAAAYFSYPATESGIFNGDNFVLLDGKQHKTDKDGSDKDSADEDQQHNEDAPHDGVFLVADGAVAVSSLTSYLTYSAEKADFVRVANTLQQIANTPWVPYGEGKISPWILAEGADGIRTVYLQFAGSFGATSPVTSDAVILDTTPIAIRDFAVDPDRVQSSKTITVSWSLSEAATSQTLLLEDVPLDYLCADLDCQATFVSSLPEGIQTISLRVSDVANWQDQASRTMIVDDTDPQTRWTQSPLSGNTTVNSASFFVDCDEPGTIECSLDGATFVTCSSPSVSAGLGDGGHSFAARCRDLADNVDSSPASTNWQVDTAPPETQIDFGPPPLTTVNTALLGFGSPSADLDHYLCSLDGVVETICTSPLAVTGLGDSNHHFVVVAVDSFGNRDPSPATHDWAVDRQSPAIILDSSPNNCEPTGDATFVFHSTDSSAVFECNSGAGFASCVSPVFLSGLAEGTQNFVAQAIDPAGNRSVVPVSTDWKVDWTAPAAPTTSRLFLQARATGASDELTGAAAAVESSATVNIYADASLVYRAASSQASLDGSFDTIYFGDDIGDGLEQIYVTSNDCAGNESTAVALLNPSRPPRVSAALIEYKLIRDDNNNGLGNSGDILQVSWNNAATGDANLRVTAVTVTIPELSLDPVTMNETAGMYWWQTTLTDGTTDTWTHAKVQALGIAGFNSQVVQAPGAVSVDNQAPDPVTDVLIGFASNLLVSTWTPSTSVDVTGYTVLYGTNVSQQVYWGQVTSAESQYSGSASGCEQFYSTVIAIDDAGNQSVGIVPAFPADTGVVPPKATVWGGVYGIHVKLTRPASVTQTELHFAPVSEVTGSAPWSYTSPMGVSSPVMLNSTGIHAVEGLLGGTDYDIALRNIQGACQSEFATPASVETLGVAGVVSGFASGICCSGPGVTYVTYQGGLGFAVANVGDVVGADGKDDVLTGVPGDSVALLVSGNDFSHTSIFTNYMISPDIVGGGPSLAAAGDVNNDGTPDYVIGSPLESNGSGNSLAGAVRVYSGNVTTTPLYVWQGERTGRQLGYAVAGLGDINGDNNDDIVAGGFGCMRYDCSDADSGPGVVYVYSGADGSVLQSQSDNRSNGFFGVSVAAGVDIDGDGINDYAVGAPGPDAPGAAPGKAYVYSGADGSEIFSVSGSQTNARFGTSIQIVAYPGAGTDRARLIVGETNRNEAIPGLVHLYDAGGTFLKTLDGDVPSASQNFGMALGTGGDLNGDGIQDIVVGDPNVPLSSVYGSGKAYVYSINGVLQYEISGGQFDGALGYAMDFVNDVNGDGIADVIIGSPGAQVNGVFSAGRIYTVTVKEGGTP